MLDKFFDLSRRTNYLYRKIGEKPVIIYEDHRCILNVIYFALQNKLISKPPNVLYFDFHDDGLDVISDERMKQIKSFRHTPPTLEEFWNFVEFKMAPNDDDWVITGMELGLINHAVVIGAKEDQNLPTDKNYTDHTGQVHFFFGISDLWSELGERGSLCDSIIKEPYYKAVRAIFQFNNEKYDHSFDHDAEIYPFVLDFDLDYFTYDQVGKLKGWPKKRMADLFYKRVGFHRMTSQEFVMQLVERSSVVTICRESDYSGGLVESGKILKRLFKVVFRTIIK